MLRFRARPAAPRAKVAAPTYPRLLGLGLIVAAAACGGTVAESTPEGESGAAGAAGSGGGDAGQAGQGGEGGYAGYGSEGPAGVAPDPYDGGFPEPDATPDAEPDVGEPEPGGIAEPPFDAGVDAWEPVDAETVDAEPGPDAEPDAELDGFAPYPYQG